MHFSTLYIIMWYIYTIITLVVLCLCVKAYVKVRDPFWYNQPVHHVYDIFSRFKNNTIINLNPPETNQYVNIINVKTERIDGMAKDEIARACDFVATNFLREKDFIEYKPTESNIMGYLDSNNHPSHNRDSHCSKKFGSISRQSPFLAFQARHTNGLHNKSETA